jgi:flagellar basal-body rod protein FlgF
MDRSLYIAMNGAKQTLMAQSANANNLANTQTIGFKNDLQQFRSQPVFGPGLPSRVYAMTERPATDFSDGSINNTGNSLDVAVNGKGWIAVQAADGSEAYTRAGDLRISTTGLLQNGSGLSVLGQNGKPIVIPPARKVDIGVDGTINIIPQGDTAPNVAALDRIKLVNPPISNLEKGQDGLMRIKPDGSNTLPAPLPADASVTLIPGALEASNANPLVAMTQMIELSRNFDLQSKVMKSADQMASVGAKLLQMA